MASKEHVEILEQGVAVWNQWRTSHPEIIPELENATFGKIDLRLIDFRRAKLAKAEFIESDLRFANLSEAYLADAIIGFTKMRRVVLHRAQLMGARIMESDVRRSSLCEAILARADLSGSDFRGADLRWADLTNARLVGTNFEKADLSECRVYGISAWDLELGHANQSDLVITIPGEPVITVDNLEIAQFIYLLLNNQRIRDVIDTITSKVVLILGRFTPERKAVLDALREALRKRNLLPVLFDFDKPSRRDITETVSTLAHMARFIIADITDAKSIPQELQLIVPTLPSVPVQPLLQASAEEYGMFSFFKRFSWVLPVHQYSDLSELLADLSDKVIAPAEAKARELNP